MVSWVKLMVLLVGLVVCARCQSHPDYLERDEDTDESKQGLGSLLIPLLILPLFTNLATGFTNAMAATFANRELDLISIEGLPILTTNSIRQGPYHKPQSSK